MRKLLAFLSISLLAACVETAVPPATPAPEASAPPPASAAPTASAAQATSAAPSATQQASTPPAPTSCVGHVDPPPAGLAASNDPPPGFAIGAPGKGALCEGKVFTAKEPVTVYRVFSASYATSKLAGPAGAYWTLQKPSGKLADYRNNYEICAEWNDLDMLNECHIEVGAQVILGPGQSAACKDGKEFPKSASNQVLIVKKADGTVPVKDCKQSKMTWAN